MGMFSKVQMLFACFVLQAFGASASAAECASLSEGKCKWKKDAGRDHRNKLGNFEMDACVTASQKQYSESMGIWVLLQKHSYVDCGVAATTTTKTTTASKPTTTAAKSGETSSNAATSTKAPATTKDNIEDALSQCSTSSIGFALMSAIALIAHA